MNQEQLTAEIQNISPMPGDILMVGLKGIQPGTHPTEATLQAWLDIIESVLHDEDIRIIVYAADSVRSITHIQAGDTDSLVQTLGATT